MSLSRDEWCKMWEAVKGIEHALSNDSHLNKAKVELKILKEVEFIKKQIQSVIGQME